MNAPVALARLLLDLGRAGIELAPHPTDPTRLRYRPVALPPHLTTLLRSNRAAVLGLLARRPAPDESESAYILRERIGVAEELGMPTHIGSPAWLIAVGESMAVNQ